MLKPTLCLCVPVFHIFYSLLICMYYSRPDDIILSGSFSSICRGFCFVPYDSIIEEEQERVTFYSEPCLHLYWTDCCVSGIVYIVCSVICIYVYVCTYVSMYVHM